LAVTRLPHAEAGAGRRARKFRNGPETAIEGDANRLLSALVDPSHGLAAILGERAVVGLLEIILATFIGLNAALGVSGFWLLRGR
jgi:hypothetical protein